MISVPFLQCVPTAIPFPLPPPPPLLPSPSTSPFFHLTRTLLIPAQQDLETTKMLFSTGAFIQRQVSRMRSSFSLSEQQEVPADVRRELDTFFNMDYEPWINTLYELHVLPSIKREYTREQILHQMFSTLQPMRSIGDMVAKATALQSQGGSSTDDAAVESQRQDLYYASLVHGAAVKTPMAEVWCPDQVRLPPCPPSLPRTPSDAICFGASPAPLTSRKKKAGAGALGPRHGCLLQGHVEGAQGCAGDVRPAAAGHAPRSGTGRCFWGREQCGAAAAAAAHDDAERRGIRGPARQVHTEGQGDEEAHEGDLGAGGWFLQKHAHSSLGEVPLTLRQCRARTTASRTAST